MSFFPLELAVVSWKMMDGICAVTKEFTKIRSMVRTRSVRAIIIIATPRNHRHLLIYYYVVSFFFFVPSERQVAGLGTDTHGRHTDECE